MSDLEITHNEKQMIYILLSYNFRVNPTNKVVLFPKIESTEKKNKLKIELSNIFQRLRQYGWNVIVDNKRVKLKKSLAESQTPSGMFY